MPKLERLELSQNQLSGDLSQTIASLYPGLVTLKIARNQISEVDHITQFNALTKLESLDVSGNPFCEKISTDKQEYQDKMRAQLQMQGLYLLDGHDKDGESIESEGDEDEDEEAEFDSKESGHEDDEESEEEEDEVGSEEDEDGEASDAEETEDTGVQKPQKKRARVEEDSDGDKVTA